MKALLEPILSHEISILKSQSQTIRWMLVRDIMDTGKIVPLVGYGEGEEYTWHGGCLGGDIDGTNY